MANEFSSTLATIDNSLRALERVHKRLDKTDELIQQAITQHKDPRGYHLAEREYLNQANRIIRRINSHVRQLNDESRDVISAGALSIEQQTLRNQAMHQVESELAE